jgi:hypothetical protein
MSKPKNHDPVVTGALVETAEAAWSVLRKVKLPRGWFLMLIGFGTAVVIWGGWVDLGQMCGFGSIQLLPGTPAVNLSPALPFTMEAYGSYALFSAVSLLPLSRPTRAFAWVSAIGALLLGFAGQAAFHVLREYGYARAPWQVIVGVSGVPVLALALAATLYHLIARDLAKAAAAEQSRQPVALAEFYAKMRPAPAPAAYLAAPEAPAATSGGDGKAAAPRRPAPKAPPAKPAATRPPVKPKLTVAREKPETSQQAAGRAQRERTVVLLLKDPELTGTQIAAALGVSPKHGRRLKNDPRTTEALAQARVARFTGTREEVHAG